MKIKHILIVSLILAIITIGAVSATEDADALAVEDGEDSISEPLEDVDLIADDDTSDDVVSEGEEEGDEEPSEVEGVDPNMTVEFPEEIVACKQAEFKVSFDSSENVSGCVYLYDENDMSDYLTYKWVNNNEATLSYKFSMMGQHALKIVYEGDSTFKGVSNSKDYEITDYAVDVDRSNEFVYGEIERIYLVTPYGFGGTISATINGKVYAAKKDESYDDDYYYIEVDNFNAGENEIAFEANDDNLGSYSGTVNVTVSYAVFVKNDYTLGEDNVVYLNLPSNATGKLILYLYSEDDEGMGVYKEIANSTLKNGYANVSLSSLGVGEYTIAADYDGDDYDVKYSVWMINIYPSFEVPKVIRLGDDKNITVRVFKDDGGVLKIYEEYEEEGEDEEGSGFSTILIAEIPVKEGIATFSLKDIPVGCHNFLLSYSKEDYSYSDTYFVYVINGSIMSIGGIEDGEEIFYQDDTFELEIIIGGFADGILNVTVDGNDYEIIDLSENYDNIWVEFNITELGLGSHVVKVNYKDDMFDEDAEVSFVISQVVIYFPEDGKMDIDYDYIIVNSPLNGNITVYVNGSQYDKFNVESDGGTIFLSDLAVGTYNITVVYEGDDGYNKTESAIVTLVYEIGIGVPEEYTYGAEDNSASIYLPSGIGNGDLIVTVDGQTREWVVKDYIYVDLSDLAIGHHVIAVKYTGDDKYSASEFNETFEVRCKIEQNDNLISLVLPADAKGNLVVEIYQQSWDPEEDGEGDLIKNETVKLVGGKASYSLSNLPMGKYFINAYYSDKDYTVYSDDFYYESDAYFDIDKKEAQVKENVTVSIEYPSDKNGTFELVIYSIDSEEMDDEGNYIDITFISNQTKKLVNGKASITFAADKYGMYLIETNYLVDDEEVSSNSFELNVMPVMDDEYEFIYNKTNELTFEFPKDTDGNVTVDIYTVTIIETPEGSEEEYEFVASVNASVKDGKAVVALPANLDIEEYHLNITYQGNYGEFNCDRLISIAPNITVPKELGTGENGTIEFELDGAEGNVSVTIDGKTYNATIENGKASVKLPNNLTRGEYAVNVRYAGKDGKTYEKSLFMDVKLFANMTVESNIPMPTEDLIFTVKFEDKFISGNVTITINGKSYNAILKSGVASINVGKMASGEYVAEVAYNGNDKYMASSLNANANVNFVPKIVAKDTTVYYSFGSYSVTVYGLDGKVISGVEVVFKIAGKKIGTAKTNAKGVATLKITQLPKTYKITAEALDVSVTKKVTVKQVLKLQKVKVKKSAKKLVIKVTLKNGKKAVNGKKITLKFNNKKYTAKTNKKGIAKFTIKKNVLKKLKAGKKVTYQATYLKDTVKTTVKVKK